VIYTQVGNCCAVETVDNTTAATKRTQPEFSSDAELEIAIDKASEKLVAAQGRPAKLAAWRELVRLIDQRSPLQVFAMEREKGLLR
jgi:hypothetical protein